MNPRSAGTEVKINTLHCRDLENRLGFQSS